MQQETGPSTQEERRILGRPLPQLIVQGIAAIVLIIFVLRNLRTVQVDFIFWTVDTSLIWALLAAAGLGFLVGFFRFRYRRG